MPPTPLTNFVIQTHYRNEPKFNGIYLRKNLCKIKYETCVIDIDWFRSIGNYWIALYRIGNIFGVEHIPKEFKKL